MGNLMSNLGLDQIESDPNAIPPGKYDGVVFRSEYVTVAKDKDTVNHVVTLKVTEGEYAGAQRTQWYTLGVEPRDADGNFAEKGSDVVTFTPTMSDQQKSWYKKLFVDLGWSEQDAGNVEPEELVGIPVTFGVKHKDTYINITFIEKRDAEVGQVGPSPVSQGDPWGTGGSSF